MIDIEVLRQQIAEETVALTTKKELLSTRILRQIPPRLQPLFRNHPSILNDLLVHGSGSSFIGIQTRQKCGYKTFDGLYRAVKKMVPTVFGAKAKVLGHQWLTGKDRMYLAISVEE
ncbi:MAG TPA: hypothetical protein VLE93_00265 [Candidatus Saccharimonadales bacterium]|nr:hypothetical protein [Candidatus Saccharimonadales bacterium]